MTGKRATGGTESVIGTDDRGEVTNTFQPPYSAICGLDILWPNGTYTAGTGYLCAERVLATVGHNLFDPSRGGRAKKVGIVPAITCGTAPFGSITVGSDDLRIHSGWLDGQKIQHDLAAIVLREPLGQRTGWAPLGLYPGPGAETRVAITGFPVQNVRRWQNLRMMRGEGEILQLIEQLVFYNADATGGQSGSPVWPASQKGRDVQVIGFHKGEIGGAPANIFVALDQDHLTWFRDVMRFLDSGIPVRARGEAEAESKVGPADKMHGGAGTGPLETAGPLPPFGIFGEDENKVEAKAKPAGAEAAGTEKFRVEAKGRHALAVDLMAGDVVKGSIRMALPSGTFTDCTLTLKDGGKHEVDHAAWFVSSSGAKDFHRERFSFAAVKSGPHALEFRELNGVSAVIAELEFKID